MTDEQLQILERFEQVATPGPWTYVPDFGIRALRNETGRPADWPYPDQILDVLGDDNGVGDEISEYELLANRAIVVAARNALPELLAEIERLRKVGSEMVNAIEQWANGEAGWSTRLRAAQEAARPVLGMGLACRKPTEAFDTE